MKRILHRLRSWLLTGVVGLGFGFGFGFSLPAPAIAGDLSVSVFSGVTLTHSSSNSGFTDSVGTGGVFGVTGAYSLLDLVQLELTGAYHSPYSYRRSNDRPPAEPTISGFQTNSRNSSFSLIPAVRVSLPILLVADLYGLAGVGLSYNKTTGGDFSYQTAGGAVTGTYRDAAITQLAYMVGVGVSASLLDSLMLDVGYRYTDIGKFKTGEVASSSASALPSFIADPDSRHPRSHDIILTVGFIF